METYEPEPAALTAFETLIRTFPNTDAANLAKQRLDQLKKP